MPTSDGSPIVPGLTADLVSLRRTMFSLSAKLMEPVFLGEVDSTFDDAITVSMLVHIGTSEDETHSHVPQWLAFLKFIVRQLNLNIEPDGFDEESREERHRLWWATYIVDRHSSLSFNLRTQMTEIDCRQLRRPIPDILWESSRPLTPRSGHGTPMGLTGVDFEVHSLDIFGIFIPIAW
jgi:xylanolytic transcriptional activator XlnR